MLKPVKINKDLVYQLERLRKKREKGEPEVVVEKVPFKPKLDTIVICDIDKTISIRGDRGIYDFAQCGIDTVHDEVRRILGLLQEAGAKIFFVTGREEIHREVTEKWFTEKDIPFDKMFMRVDRDKRSGHATKEEIYETNIKDNYNVFAVFEDDSLAVKMYKSKGLYVFGCGQK
jgi:hypothetical protein